MARLASVLFFLSTVLPGGGPLRIHPDNPKYFLFRDKPLVLITATEHYGSVINRPFDFEKYLDDMKDKRMTLTRTFLLFRELQSARNPSSPCKPESPDYIAPYPRTGPGKALDGEPAYDLDQWNPEYFDRLRRFLTKASERGIVVELTLFSNSYAEGVWALNPLRAKNNKQGVGMVDWPEYTSMKDPALVARQLAYARKIVQETCRFDNVYYEICNEPGGGIANHVTPTEVDIWQEEIALAIRDELRKLGSSHLIAGQEAFSYTPRHTFPQDKGLGNWVLDVVNVHPLPNTVFRGVAFDLGNFMSKELLLAGMYEFGKAVFSRSKPVVHDEDNTASIYRDPTGWTIHRKRAWTVVFGGAHYDYIDFSITVGSEAGTRESNRMIRTWMKHLSEFMHGIAGQDGFDFTRAKPLYDFVTSKPTPLVASTLALPGKDYAIYLGDGREISDPFAGEPIAGKVSFRLPAGRFRLSLYSPVSGLYSPSVDVNGAIDVTIDLPPFRHDLVIRIRP